MKWPRKIEVMAIGNGYAIYAQGYYRAGDLIARELERRWAVVAEMEAKQKSTDKAFEKACARTEQRYQSYRNECITEAKRQAKAAKKARRRNA